MMARVRTVTILATLLVLAAPVAGQASVREVSAEGLLRLASPDARLFAQMDGGSFDLAARQATLTLVDDWVDVYRAPSGYDAVAVEQNHDTRTVSMAGAHVASTGGDRDGVLLMAETGPEYRTATHVTGRVDVAGATDEVLESNHYETEYGIGMPYDYPYEYRSGTNLGATSEGPTHHRIEGDFTLYLWGVNFTAVHGGGAETHRTGYYESPSPVDGGSGILIRQHYVHALLEVRNGTLTASGSSSVLYGASLEMEVTDGVALLSGAHGTLNNSDGTEHALNGGVVAEGGTYALSRDDDSGVRVATLRSPDGMQGSITTHASPEASLPWGMLASASTILLLALGTVYARPAAVAGMGQMRHRRLTRHPPPRMRWRELRADGHRRLALRAESHGHPRRALRHAQRSLAIEPDNPDVITLRGSLLHRLHRFEEAVEAHKRAHEWLDALDEGGHDMARNAYQAARACAAGGRPGDALHWIGIAVRGDRDLCGDVASEPDFANIRDTAEYRSLMRGWRPHPVGGDWDDLLMP